MLEIEDYLLMNGMHVVTMSIPIGFPLKGNNLSEWEKTLGCQYNEKTFKSNLTLKSSSGESWKILDATWFHVIMEIMSDPCRTLGLVLDHPIEAKTKVYFE